MLDGYDFSKADEYPCGIKACATKHQHGYLVEASDGSITNIGGDCGKKYLNLDFDRVKNEYKARRKASDNLASITATRTGFAQYQARLDAVMTLAKQHAKCRKYLFDSMPTQLATMINMGKRGARDIVVTRRMSKREAAIHFAQTNTTGKDYDGRRPTIDEVFGKMEGGDIFRESIEDLIREQILRPLNAMLAITDFSLSTLSTKKLEDLSRDTNNAIRLITKAEELASAGVKFYSANTIKLFAHMGASAQAVGEAVEVITRLAEPSINTPAQPPPKQL